LVKRILQYTTIPSEPLVVLEEENRPTPSWPAYGEVDIRNLQEAEICSPYCGTFEYVFDPDFFHFAVN